MHIFLGTNLNSLIIYCLSSEDMYFFLWAVISASSSISSLLCNPFVDFFFETLVLLSAILLPIKSPVVSAVFWIALFEAVFIASVVDFLALSRSFWPFLLLKIYPCFWQKTKIHNLLHIFYFFVQLNISFLIHCKANSAFKHVRWNCVFKHVIDASINHHR